MANKKTMASIVTLTLMLAGIVGFFASTNGAAQSSEKILIYGSGSGPVDMDLHYAWDSASIDVLDQVYEGLITYDLSSPSLPIKPMLATSWVWHNTTCLNMTLRSGVSFHNGVHFNATQVKWSFDRLYNLIDLGESILIDLYNFPNGTHILKQVKIISEYQIQMILTVAYSPFVDLLTFSGSKIMCPGTADFNALLDYGNVTADLIGTGPFLFDSYLSEDKVTLSKNPNYWGGTVQIDKIIIQVISDANARNQAMLNKEITFLADPLPDMKATFAADSGLHLQDGPDQLVIQCIQMNNQKVNKTMRQVASYAFDYNYALANVMSNQGTRLHGIIPSGMKTYNATIPYVSTNLTKARTLMITSGMVPGASLPANNSLLTQDSFWTGKAQLPTTAFAKFNYTYNADNQIRSDMGVLLRDSLALVGIYLSTAGITWKQFVRMMYDVPPYNRNQLQFFFVGWGPDYNDPEDYVSPLFSNVSASNSALVNDPKLQGYIDAGRSTTNDTLRTQIYWNLQNYTQNDLMPWMFVYQGHNLDVWTTNLKGYYPNALDWHYFGLCYFEASTTPPGEEVPIPIGPLLTITFGSIVLLTVLEFKRLKRRA